MNVDNSSRLRDDKGPPVCASLPGPPVSKLLAACPPTLPAAAFPTTKLLVTMLGTSCPPCATTVVASMDPPVSIPISPPIAAPPVVARASISFSGLPLRSPTGTLLAVVHGVPCPSPMVFDSIPFNWPSLTLLFTAARLAAARASCHPLSLVAPVIVACGDGGGLEIVGGDRCEIALSLAR